jgi:hypothetical protein
MQKTESNNDIGYTENTIAKRDTDLNKKYIFKKKKLNTKTGTTKRFYILNLHQNPQTSLLTRHATIGT